MSDLIALIYENKRIEGFIILERDWWESHKKELKKKFEDSPRSIEFGGDKTVVYDDVRDYIGCFTRLNLSQSEIKVLERTCGGRLFGSVPMIK